MISLSTPIVFLFKNAADNARPSAWRKNSFTRSGLGLAFSLRATACVAGASLCLTLAGCNRNSSQNSSAQSTTNSAKNSASTTASSPAGASLSKTQERDWNRVLGQWWQAWQKSTATTKPASQTAATTTPLVTIDLAAIAARHPAWKLASALESNRETSLDFAAIRAAGISSQSLRSPSFDVRFDSANEVRGSGTSAASDDSGSAAPESTPGDAIFTAPAAIGGLTIAGYERGSEAVTAQGLEALQTEAADRQSDAIENFLRAVAAREADAREQYSQIRHAALENEVEQARSTPLPELQTTLLSEEEQLRVTNLRLQLLRNIFSTEEERQRARDQLNEILTRWQARLREQEKERLALLEERRIQAPRRVRAEGEAELRRDIEKLQQEQRAAIRLVWQQHQQRVQQDFGNDNARLGIILPAAFLAAQELGEGSTPSDDGLSGSTPDPAFDFIETNFQLPASENAFSSLGPRRATRVSIPETRIASGNLRVGLASQERNAMIRALRAQAWRDARKQAQSAARRFGWRWQPASNGSVSAPNRTREVLQWLSD